MLYPQRLAHEQLGGFDGRHWLICALSVMTALALQILSNLANDYGDAIAGIDTHRAASSPQRIMVSGAVSPVLFKKFLWLWTVLAVAFGLALLMVSISQAFDFTLFIMIGMGCLIGATTYTLGKNPNGYRAMGELFVLIFFGFVAVFGGFYLHAVHIATAQIAPLTALAVGAGLLCAAVLYANNIRDVRSDKVAGKITLATLLGQRRMAYSYGVLLMAALGSFVAYGVMIGRSLWWLSAVALLCLWQALWAHCVRHDTAKLAILLKTTVFTTIATSFLKNLI